MRRNASNSKSSGWLGELRLPIKETPHYHDNDTASWIRMTSPGHYGDNRTWQDNINKAKFVDSAISLMVERMVQRGAKKDRIVAKLFGGARMFTNYKGTPGVLQIGEKNILSARERLGELEISVMAECVGGDRGRTICFNVSDGSVLVRDAGGGEIVF